MLSHQHLKVPMDNQSVSQENVQVNICGVKELGSWGESSPLVASPPHRTLPPSPISHQAGAVLSLSHEL